MFKNLFSNMSKKIWDTYASDGGKGLIHTGALGWLFSSLAQVTVVATDKKISKKDKKFLVPQEICDGATNVTLYYTISKLIKGSGDWLINKGYLLTDDLAGVLCKLKPETTPIATALKGFAEKSQNKALKLKDKELLKLSKKPLELFLTHCEELTEFKKLSPVGQQAVKESIPAIMERAANFKSCIGVITAVIASIVASNFITPIVRNKLASVYQQKFILKNNPKEDKKKPQIYNPVKVSDAFKNFNYKNSMKI